jgi:hypothetical protein
LRSKTAYELVDAGNGRKSPKKFGLAPVQRENMEYEFTSVLDISRDSHLAVVSKNRTSLFADETPFLITEETGKDFISWLDKGVEPPAKRDFITIDLLDKINACNYIKELESIFIDARKDMTCEAEQQDLIKDCARRKKELLALEVEKDIDF